MTDYERLLEHSAYVAHEQLQRLHHPLTEQTIWWVNARVEIAHKVIGRNHPDIAVTPAGRFITATAGDWKIDHDLWRELMTRWPMNVYPLALAERLRDRAQFNDYTLELGAGVGNLTGQVRPYTAGGNYTHTDLNPRLVEVLALKGAYRGNRGVVWNFDEDPPDEITGPYDRIRPYDRILACNSLHCAIDPARTLERCAALLAPGGKIWLAEGVPYDDLDRPWALTWAFAIMDGWWNRGGFKPLAYWRDSTPAGLRCDHWPIMEGARTVGHLLRYG